MLRGCLEVEVDLEAGIGFAGRKLVEGRMAAHALHQDADQVEAYAGATGFRTLFEERAGCGGHGGRASAMIAHAEDDVLGVGMCVAGELNSQGIAFGVPDAIVEQVAQDDLECGRIRENLGVLD